MKDFSVQQLLTQSFEDFKKNWKVLLGAFAAIFIINFVGNFLTANLGNNDMGLLSVLVSLVMLVVQLALSVGLIRIALGVVDGKAVKIELLWDSISNWKLLLFYLLTSFIVGIATGVGFLLLIIPGVILMVKLAFSMYYVVDKNKSPIDAIKASWDATSGMFLKLLVFFVVVAVINILAALLLALPLLITVPVSMVAMARLYRKISS